MGNPTPRAGGRGASTPPPGSVEWSGEDVERSETSPRRRQRVLAWTMAALTLVLLAASLTGDGRGPWGWSGMRSIVWTYALLAVVLVVVVLVAEPHGGPAR